MDVTIAKLSSFPLALLLAGYQCASSQNFGPILAQQSAAVSTPMFKQVFERGLAIIAPIAVISTAASAYLAYKFPEQRMLYATSAVMTVGLAPFTSIVMKGGIDRLIAISTSVVEQEKAQTTGEAVQLLRTWVAQNYVRSGMGLIGGMAGLWATLIQQA